MVRRFIPFAFLSIALLVIAEAEAGSPPPLHILFIGNSYTEANDLPTMIADLAKAGKRRLIVHDRETPGGWTFKKHWDGGKAVRRIQSRKWDCVVLQEVSLGPQLNPHEMRVYGHKLHGAVAMNGAKTLYFMTWARQNQQQLQVVITKAYRDLALETKSHVAPVGVAWEVALKTTPNLVLHAPDKSHPTPAGTYLAACVFYATLFERNPEGLPATAAQVDAATARRLQAIAWQVVQRGR